MLDRKSLSNGLTRNTRLVLFIFFFIHFSIFSDDLKVAAFVSIPNIMPGPVSPSGLQVELMQAVFNVSGLKADITLYPQARATYLFRTGEYTMMLGTAGFFPDLKSEIQSYPLLTLRTILFYKKSRFPDSFSWTEYSDLTPYSIVCVRGGSAVKVMSENHIKYEVATDEPMLFRMLDKNRVDFALGTDLGGWQIIKDNFPDKVKEFDSAADQSFMFFPIGIIVNRNRDDFESLDRKIRMGLKNIFESGEWRKIMVKYYGPGNVPDDTVKLITNFIYNQ